MNQKVALTKDVAGISKDAGGVISLDTTNFQQLLPIPQVENTINLTRDHSSLLQAISSFTRSQSTGKVPVIDLNEPVMEYVGDSDPTVVSTRPPTRHVSYTCREHKCNIFINRSEIDEAAALGNGDFEAMISDMFTRQLNNDVCNAIVNADMDLAANTRLQRSLRGANGFKKQLTAGATVQDANGKLFDKNVFGAVRDALPQRWRNDRVNYRWMYNDRVAHAYQAELTNVATPMGDLAHTQPNIQPPLGIQPVLVPQIDDSDGPTAIAPTSAADNTTYITLVLTTLVTAGNPSTAALGVGRRFLVTCLATGKSEICVGELNGSSALIINTSGLLGQAPVSTTNTDYTVRPADQTSIYYGNPKLIIIVWQNDWLIYRQWNGNANRLEIVIWMKFDILVPVPESFVAFNNIAVPQLTW